MCNGKGRQKGRKRALDLENKYLALTIVAMLPAEELEALLVLEDCSTLVSHYLHRREPMRAPVLQFTPRLVSAS